MKRILFSLIIATALILSLASCEKGTSLPEITTDPIQHYPIIIDNLVAGRWIQNDKGVYVSKTENAFSGINTGNHPIKIYMVANGKETQIKDTISYMGGKLWADDASTDITLNYFPENQVLPFSYLVIKVVVE